MTNELTVQSEALQALVESSKEAKGYPEKLAPNREAEDDDGNRLPLGAYTVRYEGNLIYMPETEIRLGFKELYRYQRYNSTSKKMEAFTVLEENPFKGEYPDNLGTFKCGKVTGAAVEQLSEEERELNAAKAKYMMVIFAQVDISGAVDNLGKKVFKSKDPVWLNVTLNLSGMQAVDVGTLFRKDLFKSHGRVERTVLMKKAQKDKAGANTYYKPQFAAGSLIDVFNDAEYGEFITETALAIKGENDRILEQHVAANATEETYENELKLVTEFDDELPESMQGEV